MLLGWFQIEESLEAAEEMHGGDFYWPMQEIFDEALCVVLKTECWRFAPRDKGCDYSIKINFFWYYRIWS